MRTINYFIISVLLIASSGCMTMRPLEDHSTLGERVKSGDNVEVVDKRGLIHTFVVGKVTDEEVSGTTSTGSLISFPVIDIVQTSVERVDGGKTTLAVASGIIAAPIVLLGLGAGAMIVACDARGC